VKGSNASVQGLGVGAEWDALDSIQRRVLWLSTLIVHHANQVRPNPDGMKVGGHQASSASVVTILTALYFDFLRAGDRVSIKPHASPAFHAVQYLLGNLDRRYLTTLRTVDGLQAYPSRTKDPDAVDFSTGSVGLGSVAPNYAALAEEYVDNHFGRSGEQPRFVSVLGDAELDEGSIWETVAEPALERLTNLIWIVDLNRQSLDRVVPGIRAVRLRKMFAANGWEVIDAKYGSRLEAAFARPGGEALRRRIDDMPNDEYQRLLRAEPSEVRSRLVGNRRRLKALLEDYDDGEVARLIADLGGHDLSVLHDRLHEAEKAEAPAVIFAYTIKGWGLPIAGDPLNHSALLSKDEMAELRGALGVPEGGEFDRFEEGSPEAELCDRAARRLRLEPTTRAPVRISLPTSLVSNYKRRLSTQKAFSMVLAELARSYPEITDRVVTTSPDVATSTNLGGWINRRGIYSPEERPDVFSDAGPRILRWNESPEGNHIELGISENNLFLMLGGLGLTHELFGETLFPIGTLYDPFVARGLEAFIYALYSGARFIVVATPSGVTLAPEGGAHQSVIIPSIGLELPGLTYFEPCFGQETEWLLLEAFAEVAKRSQGTSSYLRLSTKPIDQSLFPSGRDREALRAEVLSGAYRLVDRTRLEGYEAGVNAVTVATSGAMVPEAVGASEYLLEDGVFVNVVNVTSAGRLYRDHQATVHGGVEQSGQGRAPGAPWKHSAFDDGGAPVVTVLDGHPHTLAWLPGALGRRGVPLGVSGFGRSGRVADLYRLFQIDEEAIVGGCLLALERAGSGLFE
jgi:pyruvate dehydrogenase E1 component